MSRLTRDGTAEPVSRDQILRHARGQGNVHFPCSADHEQDWQPYPVDPYSAICDDHTYIHTQHLGAVRGQKTKLTTHLMPDRVPYVLDSISTRPFYAGELFVGHAGFSPTRQIAIQLEYPEKKRNIISCGTNVFMYHTI